MKGGLRSEGFVFLLVSEGIFCGLLSYVQTENVNGKICLLELLYRPVMWGPTVS
jgi:hypothetical protein